MAYSGRTGRILMKLFGQGGATELINATNSGALNDATSSTYTQTYSTADRTHAARTASALTDNGGGATADGTIGAISAARPACAYWQAPDAASTSGGADQLDIAAATGGETMANIVQPDYARNVVINFTDGDVSISAFTVDVVGTGLNGEAVTEQFVFAGGLDQVGSAIFNTVTSVTLTTITGNGAADTLDLGYGSKLGVPVPVGSSGLVIQNLTANGAQEAASATDQSNNSFTPTTALNASVDFVAFYTYTDPIEVSIRDAVKELSTMIANLVTDQTDTAQVVNAVVDDLQTAGIVS